jgi:hypothetical protein
MLDEVRTGFFPAIAVGIALTATFGCLCGPEPPPPPMQGAVAAIVQAKSVAVVGCSVAGRTFVAPPDVDAGTVTFESLHCDLGAGTGCEPNANVVVDGDQGVRVDCQVVECPDTFVVSASIRQGDFEFAIAGTFGPDGGKAFVAFRDEPAIIGVDSECDVTIEPNKGHLVPGAIWASFNCTEFGDRSIGETSCTATGKFLFENCAQCAQ